MKLTEQKISLIEKWIASSLEINSVPEILYNILNELDWEDCGELLDHPCNRKNTPNAEFYWDVTVRLKHHPENANKADREEIKLLPF